MGVQCRGLFLPVLNWVQGLLKMSPLVSGNCVSQESLAVRWRQGFSSSSGFESALDEKSIHLLNV
jgi:hypothetical protein